MTYSSTKHKAIVEAYAKWNGYQIDLHRHIEPMFDTKERWYKVGSYWIHAESQNTLNNPNGRYKWNGWEIIGREYWVEYFDENSIKESEGTFKIRGVAISRKGFTDKDEANNYFMELKMNLK